MDEKKHYIRNSAKLHYFVVDKILFHDTKY